MTDLERKHMKTAYVFFNGELLGSTEYYTELIKNEPGDLYCADGGANIMEELGVYPKEIWGDLDSISQDILEKYAKAGVMIKKFPRDKDYTDGELILRYLSEQDYDKIVIIGGLGGRRDHELSNINLLFIFKNLYLITEEEKMFCIENYIELDNIKGKTVSFIPCSEQVTKLTLKGFKFPLNEYTLVQGSSICMSNVALEDHCVVSFESGKLIGIIVK